MKQLSQTNRFQYWAEKIKQHNLNKKMKITTYGYKILFSSTSGRDYIERCLEEFLNKADDQNVTNVRLVEEMDEKQKEQLSDKVLKTVANKYYEKTH